MLSNLKNQFFSKKKSNLSKVAKHCVFVIEMKDEMLSNFEIHLVWVFLVAIKKLSFCHYISLSFSHSFILSSKHYKHG